MVSSNLIADFIEGLITYEENLAPGVKNDIVAIIIVIITFFLISIWFFGGQ